VSHYTKLNIQAQQKYEAELISALEQLVGEGKVETSERPITLKDWQGQSTSLKAEIVVRKKTLGELAGRDVLANDLGYARNNTEGYDVHCDEAGFSKVNQNLVAQYYAEKVTAKKMRANGYSVARKELANGQIQLTCQKYG
jgi:hypothetical protein